MGQLLDDLRSGGTSEDALAAIVSASPLAGQKWDTPVDVTAAYEAADSWAEPEGSFEVVSEDLAVAHDEGLISLDEYDEMMTVVNQ